jgi:hypothetical protein
VVAVAEDRFRLYENRGTLPLETRSRKKLRTARYTSIWS